ncbi:Phosphatidylglycerophosphatase and protein-tyrosine phosphatase 1 [Chionoecetes opilio]|uniref:Phosphatidylglycerophosphatase and protein-tyrosine phosphatase 1 n=1 Tax=Chionoecetes opilio TaxID=41210 RepID=A0A8J4Y9Z9_CHIOP|nr:Phosphatidylglycerophosphatase and protein-tyrosine phosphatase 1 [Chionoecetes opilio]
MGWAFARLTFLPTLVFNVAMRRVSARKWYNQVDERLILGALPFRGMTRELVEEEGVRGVVSMNEDYELKFLANAKQEWDAVGTHFLQLSTTDIFEAQHFKPKSVNISIFKSFLSFYSLQEWDAVGVQFLQLSTTDIFEAPSQDKLRRGVAFIAAVAGGGEGQQGAVYVHCKAGRTRSATLVACYLMAKYKWSPEKAVAHIAAARPHIWLGPKQHQALATFHATMEQS